MFAVNLPALRVYWLCLPQYVSGMAVTPVGVPAAEIREVAQALGETWDGDLLARVRVLSAAASKEQQRRSQSRNTGRGKGRRR